MQQQGSNHPFDIIQSHERIPGCELFRAGDGVHQQWLDIRQDNASALQSMMWRYSPYHKAILQAEHDLFHHPNLKSVVCNSNQIKRDILTHYPRVDADKLQVIYNGIDLEQFPLQSEWAQTKARESLGLKQDDKVLIFVGSGFERKGLRVLLKAMAIAKPWTLLVVGKDKRQAQYQQLTHQLGLENRVIFCGMQTSLQDYYAASDLLVHPAYYDPAPNVVIEAMASGRGVIASQHCGNSDLIETGLNGYVFDVPNTDHLAETLDTCYDIEQLNIIGRNARTTAERFPVKRMVDEFITLYQTLLET